MLHRRRHLAGERHAETDHSAASTRRPDVDLHSCSLSAEMIRTVQVSAITGPVLCRRLCSSPRCAYHQHRIARLRMETNTDTNTLVEEASEHLHLLQPHHQCAPKGSRHADKRLSIRQIIGGERLAFGARIVSSDLGRAQVRRGRQAGAQRSRGERVERPR